MTLRSLSATQMTRILFFPHNGLEKTSAAVFLGTLGAGLLLAAWLLVGEANKTQLSRQIEQAVASGDVFALSRHTDWVQVKNNLKRDLLLAPSRAPSGPLVDAAEIDRLVEYYVRPDSLLQLLSVSPPDRAPLYPEAFVRNASLSGWREITLELAPPAQSDKPWLNRLEPTRAIFALQPRGWVLVRLQLPPALLPMQAPVQLAARRP